MNEYEKELLEALRETRKTAPPGFVGRVMANLPAQAGHRYPLRWPQHTWWLSPALGGALAAALTLAAVWWLRPAAPTPDSMTVHFEIHAPDARQVELVGTFTDWQTDRIKLTGPDASGHWTAELPLPPGRYEYIFLVDGHQWVTDPQAAFYREDGFGRENAVLAM